MKSFLGKKNARISILIILALVMGVGYMLVKQVPRPSYNAEMSLVNGRVERSTDKITWTVLKANEGISQGSYVRTGDDSRTIITLDDGSAVRLSENSQIKLASLDPKNIQITNERGEVYTRVVKADRTFVVSAGPESYKSLGTAYKTVNTDTEQGVYVYESKVKAEDVGKTVSMGNKFFTKNDDKGLIKKLLSISKNEIKKDDFLQWNKELDSKDSEFKKYLGILKDTVKQDTSVEKKPEGESDKKTNPTPDPSPENNTNPETGIYLSGAKVDGGVLLKWSVKNLEPRSGFKLVKSTEANPTYPGNSAIWVDSSARSYTLGITNGTYHFRICRYTGSGCDVYSNDITITVSSASTYKQAKVYWTVNESDKTIIMGSSYSALVTETPSWPSMGFKLVWSKNSSPTYPTREGDKYQYYSSASQRYGIIHNFDGSGTYYVRVCEYLGGACGKYSNQISITL